LASSKTTPTEEEDVGLLFVKKLSRVSSFSTRMSTATTATATHTEKLEEQDRMMMDMILRQLRTDNKVCGGGRL
jgi:hypothetical protein